MMRFNAIKLAGIVAGLGVASLALVANAQTLPAGDTYVTDLATPYDFTGAGSQFATGTMYTGVFLNAGGTYDFVYQFTVSSGSSAVSGLTVSDFTNVTSQVSEIPSYSASLPNSVTFATGGTAYSADSTTSGTYSFLYGTPITSGTNETILVHTNAVTYADNNAGILGAAAGNATILAPNGIPGPEPGALALVVPGLLGVGGMIRRRRKAA